MGEGPASGHADDCDEDGSTAPWRADERLDENDVPMGSDWTGDASASASPGPIAGWVVDPRDGTQIPRPACSAGLDVAEGANRSGST